jgi:hypothetical protein
VRTIEFRYTGPFPVRIPDFSLIANGGLSLMGETAHLDLPVLFFLIGGPPSPTHPLKGR